MEDCRISEAIFRTFQSLSDEFRHQKDCGAGYALRQSEADFMNTVHRQPYANVSRISEQLGLTKGAVTQICQKLHQKGLIEPYHCDGNRKEKYFRLTQKGEHARLGYQQYYAKSNHQLCDYVATLTEVEIQVIFNFMEKITECVPSSKFVCPYPDPAGENTRYCRRPKSGYAAPPSAARSPRSGDIE